MKAIFILCGFVIGFCLAGAIYVPMVYRSHETAQMGLDTAKAWKRLFCATPEGLATLLTCQLERNAGDIPTQPPIVKPTTERRDRNPRVVL